MVSNHHKEVVMNVMIDIDPHSKGAVQARCHARGGGCDTGDADHLLYPARYCLVHLFPLVVSTVSAGGSSSTLHRRCDD